MHHGDKPLDLPEKLEKEYAKTTKQVEGMIQDKIGATGQHPEGKLTPEDQGEIKFRVGHTDDKVIIHFGKRVEWLGMSPDQAMELGRVLIKNAKKTNRLIVIT